MPVLYVGLVIASVLLQAAYQVSSQAVTNGADCTVNFTVGKDNFVLDTADAVKDGATFISSPTVAQAKDCVSACCQHPECNLALIENGEDEGTIKTCFLFNCLYKNKYVCRFTNKVGFTNHILNSVYEHYLGGPTSDDKDPPIANAGRNIVVQPNDWVTLNGVESVAQGGNTIASYEWSLLRGDPTVVLEKTDLDDQVKLSELRPGMYVFQLKVTDSIGQSDAAEVTVLVLSPEQSDSHCMVPKKVGPCRGAFQRWHYNAASQECEEFTFGGCKGNNNNYLSLLECTNACQGAPAPSGRSVGPSPKGEECGAPCKPGQFICSSGCCLDKGLECDMVSQCKDGSDEEACSKLNRTFTRLLSIDVDEKRARCTEPPRTGPCRASHTRWYYDPLNSKCHRFTFGGCDGNKNNFEEEGTCGNTCQGVTEKHVFARGVFERFEDDESDSGPIAIAIVLAVAILAVLAILGYCFLKGRKGGSRHQPVATNIPHVPYEDRDTLVYSSTTKPV